MNLDEENDVQTNGKDNYQCEHCSYIAKRINRLNVHINTVHKGIKPFLCDQ